MQIAVHANGCVIFLEIILSSAEFSKILVSQNSEFETELMEKFTIKIILVNFFSVLRQITKACFLVTCVGSLFFILQFGTKSLALQTKQTLNCTTR